MPSSARLNFGQSVIVVGSFTSILALTSLRVLNGDLPVEPTRFLQCRLVTSHAGQEAGFLFNWEADIVGRIMKAHLNRVCPRQVGDVVAIHGILVSATACWE